MASAVYTQRAAAWDEKETVHGKKNFRVFSIYFTFIDRTSFSNLPVGGSKSLLVSFVFMLQT